MTREQKIKKFIEALNKLDDGLNATIEVGTKYKFLSGFGIQNLYHFKRLVAQTIEHTSKELERKDNE